MFRLAVFASGKGSNLRAIDEAIRARRLVGVEIALVVSNNSSSGALVYARSRGIAAMHITATAQAAEMLDTLREYSIDLIVLAGYLRKIPVQVVDAFEGRMINIHPALLPDFGGEGMYGINVHRAVLAAKRPTTGATVHYVSHEYDSGAIIAQSTCSVEVGDTPESLSQKVLRVEHELYPRAIATVVERLQRESE